jgi:hypothetical protein
MECIYVHESIYVCYHHTQLTDSFDQSFGHLTPRLTRHYVMCGKYVVAVGAHVGVSVICVLIGDFLIRVVMCFSARFEMF